jgi:hypothetical protein
MWMQSQFWKDGRGSTITQGHNGSIGGQRSELWLFTDGYAIAVIVNQDGSCTGAGGLVEGAGTAIIKNLLAAVKTIDWPDTDQF